MIQFNEEICTNLEKALQREWLETNGIGGFASSTIAGVNTRRYHGLLTAATRPPAGRTCLLSKFEETLVLNGQAYELSANRYLGAVHPRGFQYLKEFRLDPFPIFIYEVEGVQIIKSVFMIAGENSTVVQYKLNLSPGPCDCRLEIRPLIAGRDYHATVRENDRLIAAFEKRTNLVGLQPYSDLPPLYLAHDATTVEAAGYWYRNFELPEERERGLDFVEDLFQPFTLTFDLAASGSASLVASTEVRDVGRVEEYRQDELSRRRRLAAQAIRNDDFVRQLTQAADQFIVARGGLKTVIAGYHWFSDWGRDTMISLPGLLYASPSAEGCKSILLEFARHTSQGMLPNRFPDNNEEPEYNTIDATLWFFEAARALAERTGDYGFIRDHLYDCLLDIIDWHVRGTRYAIKVDDDGLLAGGVEGVQLTWMDAKVGDYVVTPRHGKPVEIQALWYNALSVMRDFAKRLGDGKREKLLAKMARRAKQSFNKTFWNDEAGYLYDVVNGDFRDASLRPNQIFAVSLPHTMLPPDKARRVVEIVERALLTPYGLRSLASGDPQYRPVYRGDAGSRDAAYHQGTVWAWLAGPFITAYVKVNQRSAESRAAAAKLLEGFRGHFREAGLGQVSEIFDADAPHAPRGCIAQAWSVAELLRAACEDVYEVTGRKGVGMKG